MSDKAWKREERKISKLLGAKRNPNIGIAQSDIDDDFFSYQVKKRENLPEWVKEAMRQAEGDCKDLRYPALILSEVQQGRPAKRFVMVTMSTWLDILNDMKAGN